MPPGGRSHSSHSSSHSHASFRSHSRSGGSSFGSSGPSRRSSSSHNSVFGGSFGGSHRSAPAPRIRSSRIAPILYRSARRNLFYYPTFWFDSNNLRHEAGYYDEAGTQYAASEVEKDGTYESTYKCEYCGTEVKVTWKEGEKPSCPNCGAPLEETVPDDDPLTYPSQPQTRSKAKKRGCIIVAAIFALFSMFVNIFNSCTLKKARESYSNKPDIVLPTVSSSSADNDSIYVEALGRSCPWVDEYDSYYDITTDCYFAYNTSAKCWQYWYEDISSDYGDFGWMEYDEKDGNWYIERGENNWGVLPGKYDTSDLWHM